MKTLLTSEVRRLLAPYRARMRALAVFSVVVSLVEVLFLGLFFVVVKMALSGAVRWPAAGIDWQATPLTLALAGTGLLVGGVVRFLLAMKFERMTSRLSSDALADLQIRSMNVHIDMPLASLWRARGGELQFHINNLPIRCREFLQQYPTFVSGVIMISVVSVLLAAMSWKLFVGALLLGALYGFLMKRVSHHVYLLCCGALTLLEKKLSESSHEALAGIRQIRVFRMQDRWKGEFERLAREHADEMVRHRWWTLLPQKCLDLVMVIVFTAGLLFYAAVRMHSGQWDMTVFVTFIFGVLRLVPYLVQTGRAYGLLASTVPSIQEYYRHYDDLGFEEGRAGASPFGLGEPLNIEFEGVSFAYGGREAVLENIDLRLESGKVTALVGLSGSGKSTLVDLLLGLIRPSQGRIVCNGVPIDSMVSDQWLKHVSLMSQESFLFHASVEENLLAAHPSASREQILEVCRLTGVDDFVGKMPRGLATIVGDRGTTLSGGQRQRIAMARALLKEAEILVLDEPTSSLDAKIEEFVYRDLWPVLKHRTAFIVSHNLRAVQRADQIFVLAQGRIVQSGTHDRLMAGEGLYRDLYRMQSVQNAEGRMAGIESPGYSR